MPSSRFKTFVLLMYAAAAVALIVALVSAPAHAQALPSSPVYVPSANGNTWTYTGGTATASNAASISFPPAANGPFTTSTTQSQSVGSGKSVPVTIKSRPSPAAVAKAVGTFAAKVATPLVVGVALWDLCNELGFGCSGGASDPLTVTRTTEGFCYRLNGTGRPCSSTPEAAMSDGCASFGMGPSHTYVHPSYGLMAVCAGGYQRGIDKSSAGTTVSPSSLTELTDAIAAKSGWPDSSAIGRTVADAVASGVPLPLPAPYEITGPASVPMSPTVTNYPDGSKVTDTPEKQVAYGPNTVTVTQTNTRTTTDPSGVTTPVSTVTTADPLPAPAETPLQTCGYPGGPACKIDETGTTTEPKKDGQTELTDGKKLLDDTLEVIKDTSNKNTSWGMVPTWLQSGASCHPVVLITFPEFLRSKQITLDICPHLDTIYLLMNALWIVWTFGAVLTMVRGSTTAGAV